MGLNEPERLKERKRRIRLQILTYSAALMAATAAVVGVVLLVRTLAATTKEEFVATGNAFASRNQQAEAIIEYRNAVSLNPAYGEARVALAKAYLQQGQLAKAMQESLGAADLLPDDVPLQLQASRYLLLARRFDDAKRRAEAVLRLQPRNVEALIAKAAAVARMVDPASGLIEIEQATQLAPGDPRPLMMLAAMQGGQSNPAEAEAAFQQAVAVAPVSVDAHHALAAFYLKSGRLAEAEAPLRRAIDIAPARLDSRQRLASYLVSAGRPAEAEAPLKSLTESAPTAAALLTLADYYAQQHRRDDARQILERLTRADDSFAAATIRLAKLHFAEGRRGVAAAHRALDELLAKDPKNVDGLLLNAQFLLAEGEHAHAVQVAEGAASIAPASAHARSVLADAYASWGDLDAAIAALNEALLLNPAMLSAQLRLSKLFLQRRDVSAAVRFADAAVEAEPGSVAARLARARAKAAHGVFADAARDLTLVTQQVPTLAVAHVQLGEVELQRKNFPESRHAFERALQLDPSSFDAVRGLVGLDVIEGRPREALASLERRLAANPNDPELLMLTAGIYQLTGDVARREAVLLKVVQLDPANLPAFRSLLGLYVAQRRLDEARLTAEDLARGPAAAGGHTLLGLILEAQRRPGDARAAYEKALATAAGSAVAANNLAWLYVQNGDSLDAALQFALMATRSRPDSPAFNDTLGWIYVKKGLPESAVRPLELSVNSAPADPQYRYHLGLAYAGTGDTGKAMAELSEALKQNPGYPNAERALQSLRTASR